MWQQQHIRTECQFRKRFVFIKSYIIKAFYVRSKSEKLTRLLHDEWTGETQADVWRS